MIQMYCKVYTPLMASYRLAKNRFVITSRLQIKRGQEKMVVEKPYSITNNHLEVEYRFQFKSIIIGGRTRLKREAKVNS